MLKESIFISLLLLSSFTATAQLEKVESFYSAMQKLAKEEGQTLRFVNADDGLVEDFSQLSQIILLRHGEPALNKKGWRKRKEAMQFVKDYDSVGIYKPAFVPIVLSKNELSVIHTSSINRSIATANKVLGLQDIQKPQPLFREFERKIFSFFNIKLPLKWWLTGSRVFWFMGMNKRGIESFGEAKKRAQKAALFLEEDAMQNGKTLLVSHGLLNHYLVKYLKKNGWEEVYDGGKGYLSQKMLVKYQ
ncbi:MAG: histidine phosphatase family protein [Bacteroidota bacterium]